MYDGSLDGAITELPSHVQNNEIFVDARVIPTLHYSLLSVLDDGLSRGLLTLHEVEIGALLLESMNTVYEGLVLKHSLEMIPDSIPDNFEGGDNSANKN